MMHATPMRRRLITAGVVLAAAATLAAQAPDGPREARANAFFAAVSSGDPATFEAMAADAFAPDLLARRTAAQRREMMERLKGDFGTMTLTGVRLEGDVRTVLLVSGSAGLSGRFELDVEPAPPHRLTRVAIEVGNDDAPEGPAPPAIDPAMAPAALAKALDAYIDARVAADGFSGVVLVARNGTPVYTRAAGVANRETQTPETVATRHNIASIGKIFTKVAIAQLMAKGALSGASTIGQLLPDYPAADAKPATVEQLLTHRGGIADFFGPGFTDVAPTLRSNADYYRYVASRPLAFAPGSQRQYCNGCYVVLGAIIERVSGMPYEDYIARHVFAPAGMRASGFFHSDRLPEPTAIGYTRRAPGTDRLVSSQALHGIAGSAGGGAYATASDLLAFDTALREHRLLDAKMTAWVLGSEPVTSGRNGGSLGIAGGAPGTNAVLESDGNWAVVVLANLDPPSAVAPGLAIHRRLAGPGADGGLRIERR